MATDPDSVHRLSLIGTGAFGQVYKACWKGTLCAAKVIPAAGNEKIIENELQVYKLSYYAQNVTSS